MCRAIVFLFAWALFFRPIPATPIIEMIEEGRIDEARGEIAKLSTAARRDGDLLYYQALLEENGEVSFQFLEAAVRAGISPEYLEDNTYLVCLYYLADGDYDRLATSTAAYLQRWENGGYRAEMLRFRALVVDRRGNRTELENLLNKVINENENILPGLLGEIDRARSLYREKKYIQAQNICRRLAKSKYDEVVVPALYMLSFYAIEQKRIDDAILYYNLLKEGYPDAVGIDDLVDKFTQIERTSYDQSAEELTGSYYSVQVGVFSVKDNARAYAKKMKKYGEKVDLTDKKISDKNYYVVYVGRFKSTETATAFKIRLEQSENEAFQVVAR
jgi:hypothetical protein